MKQKRWAVSWQEFKSKHINLKENMSHNLVFPQRLLKTGRQVIGSLEPGSWAEAGQDKP